MDEERDRGTERALKKLGLQTGPVNLNQEEWDMLYQGAESRVFRGKWNGRFAIAKERFLKRYRHTSLDQQLSRERLRAEVKSIVKCRAAGISVPEVLLVDIEKRVIVMEEIPGRETLKQRIQQLETNANAESQLPRLAHALGQTVGKLHAAGMVHGDLTTSNVMIRAGNEAEEELTIIDFGLSGWDRVGAEERAVDLYVLERAMSSTHPNMEPIIAQVLESYAASLPSDISQATLKRLNEVRQRGRKRNMVG